MAYGDGAKVELEMTWILELLEKNKDKSPQEQLAEIKRYAEERRELAKSGWL